MWLWERQARTGNVVGEIYTLRVEVTAPAAGLLASESPVPPQGEGDAPFWSQFDQVQKGDVVARLDDRRLRASLTTLEAELVRLAKELDAAAEGFRADHTNLQQDRQIVALREQVQRLVEFERVRLDYADRLIQIAKSKIDLNRLDQEIEIMTEGAAALRPFDLDLKRLARKALAEQIAKDEELAVGAKASLDEVAGRREFLLQGPELPAIGKLLAPLSEAITVQQHRIDEIELDIDALVIRAPISGTIAAVHSQPNQLVQPGTPIITIASNRGDYVLSYIRQAQRIQPAVGMPVTLRTRRPGSRSVESVVEDVGAGFELVPQPQLSDPTIPEWGLPVKIRLPEQLQARPGEKLDIVFPPRHQQSG
jgi:multidrug resistance efflux pump